MTGIVLSYLLFSVHLNCQSFGLLLQIYILKNNDLNISNNNINNNIDKNISLEPNLLLDSIISSKLADEEIVSSTLESVAIKNNLQDNYNQSQQIWIF